MKRSNPSSMGRPAAALRPTRVRDLCSKRPLRGATNAVRGSYMGPGLWFDRNTRKVHIRLSPTHNNVPGLADYSGETDPNKVALSITEKNMATLTVDVSNHIEFRNLAFSYSNVTAMVKDSSSLVFEDVEFEAGRYAVRAGRSSTLRFTHCAFDGGLPTWMFRGDVKDQYKFLEGGQLVDNFLAKQTMESLLATEATKSVEIAYSEFTNAHDLYLSAPDFHFHHNWVNNLNDEALFLDGAAGSSGQVHHNVVTQTLSAISFAGPFSAGPWYIYRNLIDLRHPTAGFRPRNAASKHSDVWRPGAAFKSRDADGSYDLFQNTFVVPFAAEYPDGNPVWPQASFTHLRNSIAHGASGVH